MKTNYYFIVAVLAFSIFFTACQKEPSAFFTPSKFKADVSENISFINTSKDAYSYEWEFGDGGKSFETNPTHAYNATGTYFISLKAFSKNNNKTDVATSTITITIAEGSPTPDFSANYTSLTQGQTVTFTDLSTNNPTSWLWNFGDGSTSSQQNPSHSYNSSGTYSVSLTVTNNSGSNTKTKSDYITVSTQSYPPTAYFSYSPSAVYSNSTVTFTDLSTNNPTSWLWNFGDGYTSTMNNPTHIYSSAGTYYVSLKVTNSQGSNTKTISIIVSNSVAALAGSYDVHEVVSGTYGGTYDYTATVTASATYNNVINIANFGTYGSSIVAYAIISGNNITIPEQTLGTSSSATISGTGYINSNSTLTISYTASYSSGGYDSSNATYTKQ